MHIYFFGTATLMWLWTLNIINFSFCSAQLANGYVCVCVCVLCSIFETLFNLYSTKAFSIRTIVKRRTSERYKAIVWLEIVFPVDERNKISLLRWRRHDIHHISSMPFSYIAECVEGIRRWTCGIHPFIRSLATNQFSNKKLDKFCVEITITHSSSSSSAFVRVDEIGLHFLSISFLSFSSLASNWKR